MRRGIVSVGTTPRFVRGLVRMAERFGALDPDAGLELFDTIEPDCPPHVEKPYAFKAVALDQVARRYDQLLWLDSVIVPTRPIDAIWNLIEREGYFITSNGCPNYTWTADGAYADLFPDLPLPVARQLNREITHVCASIIGFNLRHPLGDSLLREFYRLCVKTDALRGPWANSNCPGRPQYIADGCYTTAPCGPADVKGHRHDQTALSVVAHRLGLEFSDDLRLYTYEEVKETTIIMHAGANL